MTSPNTIIADMQLVETNLRQQIAHLNDEIAGLKSDVSFAEQQRDELLADRDTWQKRAEFSYQERSKLESRVEGLINKLSDHQRQSAIGKAIERACGELPEGFELHVECENGAGGVRLWNPGGEQEMEDLYCDSGLAGEIDNAINIAVAKGGS